MATRLSRLLQQKNGGNQSEMARYVGVSPQAVQKWVSGVSEPKGKNLQRAAEFLGVEPGFLLYGSESKADNGALSRPESPSNRQGYYPEKRQGDRQQPEVHSLITAFDPDDGLAEDMVLVPESRIEFAGGDGRINYELVEDQEPATYRRSWFQKYGLNPDHVRRFRVTGDSMEPLLFPRDTILVNLDETQVVDGRLYAIRYGEQLRVKYLSRRLDGTLILRSVNPLYKDEEVPPEVVEEHITVIGRVRDRSGTGGL
ncbi:peptidase S24-like protein [Pseudoduganella flava]|nr:S24 family peptidase [Pseudoduganella flava]TWI41056.1 peptidase S24-like protein [Pseudoduganella flava]